MGKDSPLLGDNVGAEERLPSWAATLREVLGLAVPTALRMGLLLVNEVVNMLMLSRTTSDPDAIAAVGLGNMMQNVFGMSLGLGLLSAFDTLVSQAYGAGDHEASVVVLQRGRLIVSVQLLWSAPILWFSGDIMSAIGQNPRASQLACEYNRGALPGLLGLFWQEALKSFLVNRSVAVAPLVVTSVTTALHVAWCAFFVLHLGLGNLGLGLANTVTWWLGHFLLLGYVAATAKREGLDLWALIGTSKRAWEEWYEFLAVGVPSMLQLCGEWWFFEVCALVIGYLGTVPLAAHVAALNFVSVVFMPVTGISQASAALVGQAVGAISVSSASHCAWNVRKASRIIAISLCFALAMVGILGAASLLWGASVAAAYCRDGETQATFVRLLFIYFPVASSADAAQNVLGGVVRGFGRQQAAFWVYVFCFWGFMLPLGCLLAFPLGYGVLGMWYAMAVGLSLATVVLAMIVRSARNSYA